MSVVQEGVVFENNPGQVSFSVPSPITALANSGDSVVVGTEQGAFLVGISELIPVPVYAELGEPAETGSVLVALTRDSGTLIAAENGIFHIYQSQLLLSPLTEALAGMKVHSLALTGTGNNEIVWAATEEGLFAVNDSLFDQVIIAEESAAPTVIGSVNNVLIAAFDARVYEIYPGSWSYAALPLLPGSVRAISANAGVAALATDAGLVARHSDGSYVRYTLSDTENALPVSAVAVDSQEQIVGLLETGLARVANNTVEGLASFDENKAYQHVAVDTLGNVWTSSEQRLIGWKTGTPVSFETSVRGLLEANCNSCHLSGVSAPYQDFSDYGVAKALANDIVQRVSTGQMPPPPIPALTV
ncbi:MAG TPA: hypothetical protein EYN66_08840, partial [Myxococcales bacterium]|nr:hypothetical protein [Myxococcales bacterium]